MKPRFNASWNSPSWTRLVQLERQVKTLPPSLPPLSLHLLIPRAFVPFKENQRLLYYSIPPLLLGSAIRSVGKIIVTGGCYFIAIEVHPASLSLLRAPRSPLARSGEQSAVCYGTLPEMAAPPVPPTPRRVHALMSEPDDLWNSRLKKNSGQLFQCRAIHFATSSSLWPTSFCSVTESSNCLASILAPLCDIIELRRSNR